jgi:hypothetical protein
MVFEAVKPEIKEKILSAHLNGLGRNEIVRTLQKEGVNVSAGSVSNFISDYKRQHPETPQSKSSTADSTIKASDDLHKDASSPFLNGIGKASTNSNVNSNSDFVTVKRNEGGPLSHFLPSDMDTTVNTNVNANTNSDSTSIITDKGRYLDMIQHNEPPIDFADNPYPRI